MSQAYNSFHHMIKSHLSLPPNDVILVTGGAGYIGSVLVNTLVKKGYFVRVIDREPPAESMPSQVEFIQEDIRRAPKDILKNVASVIHLAALSNETLANRYPEETKEINTKATIHLAKKAKEEGVSRFIFASSSSIYDVGIASERGEQAENAQIFPDGEYSISKYNAEKALLTLSDQNFSVIILRKATVCGYSPNMRLDLVVNAMIKSVLEKGIIKVFCKGLQWRPLISVDDVARVYHKSLIGPKDKIGGQIFNIGTDNFRVRDIALLIQKTMKKHFSINPEILFEHDDRTDRSYRIITTKAKEILAFIPEDTIEQTIIDLVVKIKQKSI